MRYLPLLLALMVSTLNAIPILGCGNLASAGVYTIGVGLTLSLGSTCLVPQAPGITIDCQGNTLTSLIGGTAVHSTFDSTTIKNCRFSGYDKDIVLINSSRHTISNITGGTDYGLIVNNTNDSVFSDLAFDAISIYGVWVANNSNRNNFTNVSVNTTGSGIGVFSDDGDYNIYANSTIITNGTNAYGIKLHASSNNWTIVNNTINTSGSSAHGIYTADSSSGNNTIRSNLVNVTGSNAGGILVADTSRTIIENNTAYSVSAQAIYFYGTSNVVRYNLGQSTTFRGLYAEGNRQLVHNNTFRTGSGSAVFAGFLVDSNIFNNTMIATTGFAMTLELASMRVNITENYLESNSSSAAVVFGPNGAVNDIAFTKNTILFGGAGIALETQLTSSSQIRNNSISVLSSSFVAGIRSAAGPSNHNIVSGNNISSNANSGSAILINDNSQNWTIANNTINTSGSASHGIRLDTSSVKLNLVHNNTINVTGASSNAVNITSSSNNTFSNNTFSSETAIILDIDSAAPNNTFYYNNFTKGSKFVRNLHASTQFNTSVGLVAKGNYYADIAILDIFDSDGDGFGDYGMQYPYNATYTTNFTGLGADYGPMFARFVPLSATPVLIYPANNTVFGPNQCWLLAILNTTDNAAPAAPRSSSCRLYTWDGFASSDYLLIQTLSNATSANSSFNFTIPSGGNTSYRINCTAVVNGGSFQSPSYDFQVIGTNSCTANQSGEDQPAFVWLIIVGITLMLGAYGFAQWPGVAFMVLLEMIGMTASGSIAALGAGQTMAIDVFIWFFNLTAIAAVLAVLWFIYELIRYVLEQMRPRGI